MTVQATHESSAHHKGSAPQRQGPPLKCVAIQQLHHAVLAQQHHQALRGQ